MKVNMSDVATKQDIEDVLTELRGMTQMVGAGFNAVDMRFAKLEFEMEGMKHQLKDNTKSINNIFTHLDSMAKRLETADQERLIMSHQITRAFTKLGIELT